MLGRLILQAKSFKVKSFLLFNFAITKICVAIRLAKDVDIMSTLDTNCLTMATINQEIADECLDNLILNVISTIRKNKKRLDASSIYEFIYKELKNPDIIIKIIEKKTIFLNQQ